MSGSILVTRIGESFPQIGTWAPDLAEAQLDLADPLLVCRAVAVIVASAERDAANGDPFTGASRMAEQLASANRSSASAALDLMMLAASIVPLEYACAFQDYDAAWRWAVQGMADDAVGLQTKVATDLERPFRASTACAPVGPNLVLRWVGQVSYLAWNAAYLRHEATYVVDRIAPVLSAALAPEILDRDVANVAHVASWMHRIGHNALGDVVGLLLRFYNDDQLAVDARLLAGRALATSAGEASGVSRRDRATEVLARQWPMMPTDRLQLLTAAVGGEAEEALLRLDELCAAALDHDRHVEATARDAIEHASARGRMWSLILGIVHDLAGSGYSDAASRLIGSWFGLRPDEVRAEPLLITMRDSNGVLWATGERSVVQETPRRAALTAANEILDLALIDPVEIDEPVPESRRGGTPELSREAELHDAFLEGLRPDVGALLCDESSLPRGLINLSFQRAPMTWMIAEAGGPVLPLVVSNQRPAPDRPIRRADVWFGDLVGAEEEAAVVQDVLASSGCDVSVVESRHATALDFRDAYESTDADLLWIVSHASFGHVRPRDTRLQLSSQTSISLDQLSEYAKPSGDRRLLVLNCCESGVNAGLGGPSTIGIGSQLACSSQAVVSHMWPVGFREALIFGALLARFLADEQEFFTAFDCTIRTLLAGQISVRDALPQVEVLQSHTAHWDLAELGGFLRVASPCFLE